MVLLEPLIQHRDVVVKENDLVMAMTGATIGKAGWYESSAPALLNQRVCVIRANEHSCQRFIWFLIQAQFYLEHISITASGGAQPNISDTELVCCSIPIPPKNEQKSIADYLDKNLYLLNGLHIQAEQAIAILQERRTALISAAVTGQIDVRGFQPVAA